MDRVNINRILEAVNHQEVIGDAMEEINSMIEPSEISYSDGFLIVSSLRLGVKNARLAFAQALSVFSEPEMIFGDYVEYSENSIIDPTLETGSHNVIGGCGFGYERDENGIPYRIPHLGNVVIGKHVSIGSNVCIDRGVIGSTVIGDYTKIDNLVHVAHNVEIGKRCLIVAGTVIGGSAKIGDDCFLGINCSIKQKVKIGSGVIVGMGAVVLSDVPDGTIVKGIWNGAQRHTLD